MNLVLGIIYGDIGTSPIYTLKFIVGDKMITDQLVLGGLSCVFWTLTLITTIKYIYLALNADNKGEGGIFALYALVRRYKAGWVIYPAMIGCCTLIADGFITPAISVSSAVEGLRLIYPRIPNDGYSNIVFFCHCLFFNNSDRRCGQNIRTNHVCLVLNARGLGISYIIRDPSILKAINPVYALDLLINIPEVSYFWAPYFFVPQEQRRFIPILVIVVKTTSGLSWVFVKICLTIKLFWSGRMVAVASRRILRRSNSFFSIDA